MLSAKGRDVEVNKGIAVGADAYVTKPFSTKDLDCEGRRNARRMNDVVADARRSATLVAAWCIHAGRSWAHPAACRADLSPSERRRHSGDAAGASRRCRRGGVAAGDSAVRSPSGRCSGGTFQRTAAAGRGRARDAHRESGTPRSAARVGRNEASRRGIQQFCRRERGAAARPRGPGPRGECPHRAGEESSRGADVGTRAERHRVQCRRADPPVQRPGDAAPAQADRRGGRGREGGEPGRTGPLGVCDFRSQSDHPCAGEHS